MNWSTVKPLLAKLVDTSKLAGYVRGGVAAVIGVGIAKWPLLGQVLDPQTQTELGVAAAGIVVGLWSHYVKNDAAKAADPVAK